MITAKIQYLFCLGCEGCLITGVGHESWKDTISSPSTDLDDGTAKKKCKSNEADTDFINCKCKRNNYIILQTGKKRNDTSCCAVFNLYRCYTCA